MQRSIRGALRTGARRTAVVVSALAVVGAVGGAVAGPAAAQDIETVSAISLLYPPDPGEGGSATTTACAHLDGVSPSYGTQHAEICVRRNGNDVKAFAAYSVGAGTVYSRNDVHLWRCRDSDNVCVEVDSAYKERWVTSSTPLTASTPWVNQTWSGRYYVACGYVSVSTGFYLNKCSPAIR